jgi:AcrR family transcriptional regulator
VNAEADVRRKPAQKRGELRVQQILDASEALTLEMGAESVTTNHIAKRAEVNVGTLYHFFSNKTEIFLAILARSSSHFEETVIGVGELPHADAEEWIARLVEAQTEVWLANAASVLLYDALRSDPVTNSLVAEGDRRIVELYCQGFKQFCPHIAPSRRRHVGRALLIMSYALHEDVFFAPSPRERQARIREIYPAVRSYVCEARDSQRGRHV